MASQQSVRRVTRGTVKRNTVDGEVLTSARAKAAPDERVHILPADTASLMGFGAGTDSDEECAAALEPHDSEGLGPFETQHSQSNESEMEPRASVMLRQVCDRRLPRTLNRKLQLSVSVSGSLRRACRAWKLYNSRPASRLTPTAHPSRLCQLGLLTRSLCCASHLRS